MRKTHMVYGQFLPNPFISFSTYAILCYDQEFPLWKL